MWKFFINKMPVNDVGVYKYIDVMDKLVRKCMSNDRYFPKISHPLICVERLWAHYWQWKIYDFTLLVHTIVQESILTVDNKFHVLMDLPLLKLKLFRSQVLNQNHRQVSEVYNINNDSKSNNQNNKIIKFSLKKSVTNVIRSTSC
jgi:hypothetical protein